MQSKRTLQKLIIGTDVGGTKIAAGLIDLQGNILASIRRPTDISTPEATLDSIADAVRSLISENHLDIKFFDSLGFGIPGLVDSKNGIGIASVNLGWENVRVSAGLEARLGIHCVIDNDVRTGAIGEAHFGAAKEMKNVVYVNIGTGISAVIMFDGKFYVGSHGLAGEIGHTVVVPSGPECKCGGRGCLEAVASGPGIVERALEKIKTGQKSIIVPQGIGSSQPLTAENIYEAALRNDLVAIETLNEIGELMSYSLEYLALAYDPDVIVIGGSVLLGNSFLFQVIEQKLQKLANNSWVFGKIYTRDLIKLSSLGNNAGVLGAAALVAPHI